MISRVSRELGPDAVIVSHREYQDPDGASWVEVIAAKSGETKLVKAGMKKIIVFASIGLIFLVVLTVFITWFFSQRQAPLSYGISRESVQTLPVESQPMVERNTIAVLPFADLSPNKDQEYFCDGVAEEIINKLARVKDLKVISRSSSFYFKGKNVDIGEISRQLGVSAILEGSVRRSGSKLRIAAQLIDVSDKSSIWSDSFDREQEDIFAIQEEVALAVVNSLKLELGVEERRRITESHETSPEVYELYLQGRFARSPRALERLETAISLFDRAIEKDPSYAPAYAMKALCYIVMTLQHASKYPPAPTSIFARSAAARAEELNPELADVHLALARIKYIYDWDWQGSEQEYLRALELAPGRGDIHASYGDYLQTIGRFDEGIAELDKAMELDPLSISIRMDAVEAYHAAGRYEEAIRQCERIDELVPNYFIAIMYESYSYAGMGKAEEAIALLERLESVGDFWRRPMLIWAQALVHAKLGRNEESRKYLAQLLEITETMYFFPTAICTVYALLGDNDSAFEWLETAYEERDPHVVLHLKADFWWGELQSDLRFNEYLKKTGLQSKRQVNGT